MTGQPPEGGSPWGEPPPQYGQQYDQQYGQQYGQQPYPPYGPPPVQQPPQPQYAGYHPPPPAGQGRGLLIALAALVAVLAMGGAALAAVLTQDDDEPGQRADRTSRTDPTADPTSGTTDVSTPTDVAANLDGVQIYEDLDPTHQEGHIDYPQSPPVGGHHNPQWLDCGVYEDPVPLENVVHDLEHGTVWITYDPESVDVDGASRLAGVLPSNGILSPFPGLRAPVVLTVWGRQLDVTGPEDPRIPLFIDQFQGGVTAPEPFASCVGGIRPEDSSQGF